MLATGLTATSAAAEQGVADEGRAGVIAALAADAAFSHLADSDTLTGSPLVAGVVEHASGDAVASQFVYLAVIPAVENMSEAVALGAIDAIPVARTTTSDDGSYELRTDPKDDSLATAASEAGIVDLAVVAVGSGSIEAQAFSALSTNVAGDASVRASGDEQTSTAFYDANSGATIQGVEVDIQLAEAAAEPFDDNPALAAAPGQGPCPSSWRTQNLGNRWVDLMSIHITAGGKKMRFTYTGSASTTLGVGVSLTKTTGSYNASGTITRTRDDTTSYPWYTTTGSRMLETQFSYAKYCVNYGGQGYQYHRYEVRAVRHEGGTNVTTLSVPSAPHCSIYNVPGSGGSKTTSAARTWTAGASLSSAIGINLSSRTGFTTTAKLEWEFTTPGRLCGTNASPGGTPQQLVMKGPA